ncbi:DinB family protein [Lederbergia sp. NSJ-179]|uniref:DinB family protein n=1 Tax=Lederbergia sp. NSJ-179 TaxID=2931402 RepID=UPI001FD2DC82|nr:DinB family protein [Lederbergia sp. NSJ-179]MCJ7839784.1 DinB family protein [Lederbergia sp. NSJ-179]
MIDNEKQTLLKEFKQWPIFVGQLDPAIWDKPVGEGKWAVRDVVSHILLWDQYFYEEAIKPISEDQPLTVRHLDFDTFNQNAREFAKSKTDDELINLTRANREQIVNAIREQSDENFEKVYQDAEGHPFAVKNYLRDFIWHDQHHRKQIEALMLTFSSK